MRTETPYEIENPEFECDHPTTYALEAKVTISDPKSGYKSGRLSTLTFRTDNAGGYAMSIALRSDHYLYNKEWVQQEKVAEIVIQFHGDYESDNLIQFLQHAGRMSTVFYGDIVPEDAE
jgi:hypothetical protein